MSREINSSPSPPQTQELDWDGNSPMYEKIPMSYCDLCSDLLKALVPPIEIDYCCQSCLGLYALVADGAPDLMRDGATCDVCKLKLGVISSWSEQRDKADANRVFCDICLALLSRKGQREEEEKKMNTKKEGKKEEKKN